MSCLDAIDLCLKDQACKTILECMEKYCENMHSWTEFSNQEPVCSANCLQAIIDLSLNSIGSKWSHQCICNFHKSKPATFFTLLRDDDFEKKCAQIKRDQHTFCLHKLSCKG